MRKTSTLLALGLTLAGCGSKKPIAQAPQAVQTKRISSDPTAASGAQRFSAVVEPDARVPVSFRIPGYVTAIKQTRGEGGRLRDLAEGDRVSAGTVLVRIRSAEYQDKVHQAASQAAAADAVALKAKLDYERATRLFASQSLTKADFDGAQAQYDSTQSQVTAARALTSEAEVALRDTSVVAPFDGEIVEKAVELGAFVGPGSPVFAVARTDRREDRDRGAGHGVALRHARRARGRRASTPTATARSRRGSAAWRPRPIPGRGTSRSRSRSRTATMP